MYPKLTEKQLQRLYSSDYIAREDDYTKIIDKSYFSKFKTLKTALNKSPENANHHFLDYGCGANPISIQYALERGYIAHGMEISPDVRELAAINSGAKVFSKLEIEKSEMLYDVIFLGDVLEHLVDPIAELDFLKSKLTDKGRLLAQGPLQGSHTLLHNLVRIYSGINTKKVSDFPPYHVSLAGLKSMQKLFDKSGFAIDAISVSEVTWPAPTFQEVSNLPSARNILLFLSKSLDKIISKLLRNYGSRYFVICSKQK